MKAMMWLLLCAPVVACAADTRQDYRGQWPLALAADDAGAYRVELGEPVYQQAVSPALADVVVLNAAGEAVPTALQAAALAAPAPRVLQAVPWFALPAQAAVGGDLQLIAQRDATGRVQRIETAVSERAAARAGGWLIDASAVHGTLHALQLEWQAPSQPLQLQVQVDSSNDLRHWQVSEQAVTLVDLANAGARLQQRRIALDTSARYLRVVPMGDTPLPVLRQVQVQVDGTPVALPLQWRQLAGKAADKGWVFELDGRFPVSQVDLALEDNSAVEWTLYSRDNTQSPWVRRAGPWLAFKVGAHAGQSPPQVLRQLTRDRYWRLVPAQPSAPPQLRWGYRPESVVFLAQGAAPYALAAGSTRAQRTAVPLANVLGSLRQQHGSDWQPAIARIDGALQVTGGESALSPKRDWKNLALWGVLVIGALLVAGFAASLLRQSKSTNDAD